MQRNISCGTHGRDKSKMKDYSGQSSGRKTSLKDKTKNGLAKMQSAFQSNTTMYFNSTVGHPAVDRRASTGGMVKSTYENMRRLSVKGQYFLYRDIGIHCNFSI